MMITRDVEYYAEGEKILGRLCLPDDYEKGQKLPCIVTATGYTGIRPIYLELMGRHLTKYGYATLGFDFRHMPPSDGPVMQLTFESTFEDVVASIVFAQEQPEVDPDKIALYGWGQGGVLTMKAAAEVPDVKAVACVNSWYNFERQIKDSMGADFYCDLIKKAKADRAHRVLTGETRYYAFTEFGGKDPVILDENGNEKAAYAENALASMENAGEIEAWQEKYYKDNWPPHTCYVSFDSFLRVRAEEFVQKIAPRGLFLVGSTKDTVYPYSETQHIYDAAGPGKFLYTVDDYHSSWMMDGHPEFDKFLVSLVKFYDMYLK